MKHTLNFGAAFAEWNDEELIIGNGTLRRIIDLSGCYSSTRSMCVLDEEFASADHTGCDCSFYGINPPGREYTDTRWRIKEKVSARIVENDEFDAPHLEVRFSFEEERQQAVFTRIFRVYPDIAAISVQNTLVSGSIPNCYWTSREELSTPCARFPQSYLESAVDSFVLDPSAVPQYSVEFRGRTDYTNDLVIKHPADGQKEKFNGNLFLLSRQQSGTSLLVLQEAPPSSERRDFEKYDFRFEGQKFLSCCWGAAPGELICGRKVTSYRTVWIGLKDPAELTCRLHHYLKKRFPVTEKEAAILVNPWGCGEFPVLASEKFLWDEIAASAEIGAEIYQIDDSWQLGKSLTALASNNLAVTMDFWKTDPERLPEGFAPLCAAAQKAGIKLGLWCAPSYPLMYRDHREFAEMLLEYHKKYGFATVKVDAVRIQSLEAQENLESLLREVRQKSGKKIFFNLDTTNGQRPGYFYFLEYGNIFLENRYCFLGGDQAIAYHPEKTLRNLWQLSSYVRPQTLQIEIPSPDDTKKDIEYQRDPREYDFDYWCALALFANMLIWTSPSRCSAATREVLKKMTALGKEVRNEIFDSTIHPVGHEPDGKSFTGFASDSGLWLIFREKNCPQESFTLPADNGRITAGHGQIQGATLTMPPASWCVVRL